MYLYCEDKYIQVALSANNRKQEALPPLSLLLAMSVNFLGPEHTGHFVQPHVAALCGGDIYSRRKQLFSSFGEHTAVCGSSVRQAVARPRHRKSVCIHNIHVAATCRPSVLGSATMRGHMWLDKVASVLGPLSSFKSVLTGSGYDRRLVLRLPIKNSYENMFYACFNPFSHEFSFS